MRAFVLGAVLLALSGCGVVAVPPAVTIASYAADGVSFLVSGKSLTDHAISEVADSDCAMWRLVKMENPCLNEDGEAEVLIAHEPGVYQPANGTMGEPSRLWEPPEPGASDEYLSPDELGPIVPADAVAEAEPARAAADAAASEAASDPAGVPPPPERAAPIEPVVTVERLAEPAAGEPLRQQADAADDLDAVANGPADDPMPVRIAALPVVGAAERPVTAGGRRFLVIGSFADRANAEGLARANPRLAPIVAPARVDGRRYYRVVTETAAPEDAAVMRKWLRHNGFADAWPIAACGAAGGAPGCLQLGSADQTARLN